MPKNANQSKQSNYSLDFDGGQYIDTNYYLPDGTKPKSISYWFKNTDPNGWSTTGYNYTIHGGALSTGAGFGMGALGSNFGSYLWFIGHSTGDYFIPASATGVMTTNVWYHIVVTYDNSRTNNLNFYLDGVKIDETNETLNTSTANSVKIGVSATGGGNSGGRFMQITDVCIFDYALSDGGVSVGSTATGQIAQLYGNGSLLSNPMALPSSPIAYYPLGTSAWNGEYLAENNAIGDYVFDFGTFTSNDRIVINNNFDTIITGTDFTISSWVNLDSVASNQLRFIFTNESLQFTITNKITTYLRGASGYFLSPFDSNTTLSTGKWYNVVLVKSGSDYTYYLNGSADGTVNNSTSVVNSSETTSLIGDYYGAGTLGFDGRISNTQIFNTALSATDIETLYNYGSPIQTLANIPQSSNLKAWYKLDATEIYNSTSTEWEVSDATAAIKLSTLQNAPGSSAYRVSDSSGVINFPSQSSGTLKMSTSIWFYAPSGISSGKYLQLLYAGPQSRLWLGFSGSNQLRCIVTNGGWMLGNYVTMGQWNQLTATIDVVSRIRTVKFYINGQPAGTASQNGGAPTSATDGITVSAYGYGTYSEQVLSSNSVFWENVILTDAEVLSHYNSFSVSNGVPTVQPVLSNFPQSSNISGWYKLDGNPKDSSGNSRDATYGSNNNVITGPSVSNVNGQSSGMTQSNLVQSDLLTTSSYSPYALAFDGNDYIDCGNSADFSFGNGTTDSPFSTSFWFKLNSNSGIQPFLSKDNVTKEWTISIFGGGGIRIFLKNQGSNNQQSIDSTTTFSTGVWYHAVTTYDGRGGANAADGLSIYINGSLDTPTNVIKNSYTAMSSSSSDVTIGKYGGSYINGVMSNVSIWNTALTSSQVREIYNEGRPSNLHNFSGTAPVAWWQLGENSSFNGNDWIVADEIGSSNGESDGMGVDALTNGVGATANGVSSGMSEGSLVGDAPYSTANAISSGMPVTARGTDVPPTP